MDKCTYKKLNVSPSLKPTGCLLVNLQVYLSKTCRRMSEFFSLIKEKHLSISPLAKIPPIPLPGCFFQKINSN